MMNIFVNLSLYQLAWFLCVLRENTGAAIALPFLLLHLYLSPNRRADLKLMVQLLCAGSIIDGSLHFLGVLEFNVPAMPIPFWLAVIWLFLATLPHHSLKWMKRRPLLSVLFGAIGGPLAYWAGVRFGAADFGWSMPVSLIVLGMTWAILWPIVMHFANRTIPRESIAA